MTFSTLVVATAISMSLNLLASQSPALDPQDSAQVYIAPSLGISSSNTVAIALGAAFPTPYPIVVRNDSNEIKKTLHNCLDYLALEGSRHSAEAAADQAALRLAEINCDALDWIKMAKPAVHRSFESFSFKRLPVRSLPPEFAMNVSKEERIKAELASKQGKSVLAMEPSLHLKARNAHEATLISPDWKAFLSVFAIGDFLGDGKEELLVRSEDSANGGSYTSVSLFLVAYGKNGLVVVGKRP